MSNNVTTKAQALARLQALVAGTQKHYPTSTLTFGNTTTTSTALIALFQSVISAMQTLDAAQASAKDAMAALRTTETTVEPVMRAYQSYLLATYGTATQTLADFGLEPRKAPKPLTSEQKAAKAAKALATRALRGTKGPVQKAAIKAATAQPAQTTPAKP
jgi:hypothetical protein